MIFSFFKKSKSQAPACVESVDDYPHLKIVKLKGQLDISTIQDVQSFLQYTKKKENRINKSVLLDLKNVSEVDSAAVAGFVKVLSKLKEKNFKLGLMNIPENLKSMLQILKLENVFAVFESERKAFSEILAWSEEWD
jgi:anti-anti-sigma factor